MPLSPRILPFFLSQENCTLRLVFAIFLSLLLFSPPLFCLPKALIFSEHAQSKTTCQHESPSRQLNSGRFSCFPIEFPRPSLLSPSQGFAFPPLSDESAVFSCTIQVGVYSAGLTPPPRRSSLCCFPGVPFPPALHTIHCFRRHRATGPPHHPAKEVSVFPNLAAYFLCNVLPTAPLFGEGFSPAFS